MSKSEWSGAMIFVLLLVVVSVLGLKYDSERSKRIELEVKKTRYLGVLSRDWENGNTTFFTGNVPLEDSGITWWVVIDSSEVTE